MSKRNLIEQLDEVLQGMIDNPRAALPRAEAGVSRLLRVAAELRDLPRADFKIRLKE